MTADEWSVTEFRTQLYLSLCGSWNLLHLFFLFCWTSVLFVGPLIPLFQTSAISLSQSLSSLFEFEDEDEDFYESDNMFWPIQITGENALPQLPSNKTNKSKKQDYFHGSKNPFRPFILKKKWKGGWWNFLNHFQFLIFYKDNLFY